FTMGGGHTVSHNLFYQDATRGNPALECCGAGSTVDNNTIVDNGGGGGIAIANGDDSGATFRNNIVCGHGGAQIALRSASQSNNLTTCPQFVDRAGGDFHLMAGANVGDVGAFAGGATVGSTTVGSDAVPPAGQSTTGGQRIEQPPLTLNTDVVEA